MQDATSQYACLLIDRDKPGVYSTLHVLDQRWWDWLHQQGPAALRQRSSVLIPLPEGCVTEDGETVCHASAGSFHNDLMHAAVSAVGEDAAIRLPDLDPWIEEEKLRAAAHAACAERGIRPDQVLEGLWY